MFLFAVILRDINRKELKYKSYGYFKLFQEKKCNCNSKHCFKVINNQKILVMNIKDVREAKNEIYH